MLNGSDTSQTDGGGGVRLRLLPEVMMVPASSSSSPGVTAVIICMTIMAVCAVLYFAIRYYFEERRWKAGAMMCKCLPSGAAPTLSTIECANICRYREKRVVNVGVQTIEAATMCCPNSDVKMTEARLTGRKYVSPANNNEAVPHRRPPATGSSHRHERSSGAPLYHHGRTSQKKRYFVHHSTQYPSEHSYPLRRSRNISMIPSVFVQSASSSDSYSHLAMSHASKSALPVKDLTSMTFSASDEDEERRMSRPRQRDGSGCTDDKLNASSFSYHPRYNTPVSELNTNEDELTAVVVNVERAPCQAEGGEESPGCSNRLPTDDAGYDEDVSSEAETDRREAPNHVTTVATQVCAAIECTVPLKSSAPGSNVGSYAPSVDTIRYGLWSSRSDFPPIEVLDGGRFVTRWTQTDNASVMSLDWDHFDERMRGVEMGIDVAVNTDIDMITDPGTDKAESVVHIEDEHDATAGTSSATLLMVSHTSGETSHHPTRNSIGQRSSSPYVLCFACSEEYGIADDRRASITSANGVTTISLGQARESYPGQPREFYLNRPPSAPPHPTPSSGPTPPERQRRYQSGSLTAPRPARK